MSKNIDVSRRRATSSSISKLVITFTHTHPSSFSCIVHCNITPPFFLIVCTSMKTTSNNKTSQKTFLKAPIGFWETAEEEKAFTTGQSHHDATIHEVKYDPSKKESSTYKLYLEPFDSGTAEQWLKFKAKLMIVINGNGLNEDGPALFLLTCSSLKGEALRVFQDKAKELKEVTKENHIKCLQAVTKHVFPDQALRRQKRFMRNSVFLHLNDRMVNEFCARWIELDNYLEEFPPFEPNQRFADDEVKDILYNIIPARWKSSIWLNIID